MNQTNHLPGGMRLGGHKCQTIPMPLVKSSFGGSFRHFCRRLAIAICLIFGLTLFTMCQSQTTQSSSSEKDIDHEWVDMGTSVKWATCNVGANSPTDCGDYFAWGETSTKEEYSEENSGTYGKDMSSIAGNPTYDVARAKWGADWRMPTKDEFKELMDKCKWEWTGSGMKVTAKNGNSIFLPAAGLRVGTSLDYAGENGYYWSASPSGNEEAFGPGFDSGADAVYSIYRYYGLSVRPVRE